jgi:hypothetical protein
VIITLGQAKNKFIELFFGWKSRTGWAEITGNAFPSLGSFDEENLL